MVEARVKAVNAHYWSSVRRIFIIAFFVKVFRLNSAIKQKQKKTGKKWMYEDTLRQLGGLAGFAGGINLVLG